MAQTKTSGTDDKELILGFSSSYFTLVDSKDAIAAIDVWGNEFAKSLSSKKVVKAVVLDDLSMSKDVLLRKKVKMVAMSSLEYLKIKDKIHLDPAIVGLNNGEYADEYLLLVRRDKNISNLSQLRRSNIYISAGGKGVIANMWLSVLLAENKMEDAVNFFSGIKQINKESQLILPVFFGQIDACIVTRNSFQVMSELNPQISKRLKILEKSDKYLSSLFCFTSNADKSEREELFKAAMDVKNNPSGRQILILFKNDGLIKYQSSYIVNIETLLKKFDKLKTKKIGLKK